MEDAMKTVMTTSWLCLSLLVPAFAQQAGEAVSAKPAASAAASDAGRAALAAARQQAAKSHGLRGPERGRVLELAATAHDKVAADFHGEPVVAGPAAFAAAELWRQQGSFAIAEKDYLLAATIDPARYGQRGTLGAADMQRRQKRLDEAMVTYARAEAVEPGSARAQDARLWRARLLQTTGRLDEAIPAFQAALESADTPSQVIEASNFLALAWIDKGEFDAAERAISHAERTVAEVGEEDAVVVERLQKASESMSARKALQRARDKQNQAGKDAAEFDAGRKRDG